MSTNPIYGALNGDPIPAGVNRDRLPLGRRMLRIIHASTKVSSKGDSINFNFAVASADRSTQGTAFLRINARHIPFTIGPETFGNSSNPQQQGYFDPTFPTDGLARLQKLANIQGTLGQEAGRELARARRFLSMHRALNLWAGVAGNLFNPNAYVTKEIDGVVNYEDEENNRLRVNRDGSKTVYVKDTRKNEPLVTEQKEGGPPVNFDFGTVQATVGRVYEPKAADAEEGETAETETAELAA